MPIMPQRFGFFGCLYNIVEIKAARYGLGERMDE